MTLTLLRPDDWHLHLRDGVHLGSVVQFTARQFARAIVMPNLKPPVTTVALASAYRDRILQALVAPSESEQPQFEPLMTLYLTDATAPSEIKAARDSGFIVGAKLYPAGATTNSNAGVTATEKIFPALAAMEEHGLVFQVHGEVTDSSIDIFDREAVFIDRVMAPVVQRFPRLKVVFEHVTTREAVQFVKSSRPGVAATITPQHLLLNRNAIFQGGIRPHLYCLPVLKREPDRQALIEAATGDDSRFFLGTDSAPHAQSAKHAACGCAGIYTAHAALPLYAQAFESKGALARLEGFASHFGADFYGLSRNTERIELLREPWQVPASYELGDEHLTPLCAGETLAWQVAPVSAAPGP